MASVDVMTLRSIYESVRALFLEIYNQEVADYTLYAMEVPSGGQTEVHNWLGAIPTLKEWAGPRVIDRLSAFEYTVENKDWQLTLEIPRNAIEDDRVGLYRPAVEMMARQARNHPSQLALRLFETNPVGYDGQPLFSVSHREGDSGTQSNILNGSGVTLDQILADLDAADARFADFKNDRGEPILIGGRPLRVTHVMVPNGLLGKFRTIQNADMIQNTNNRWRGNLEIIVNPYLADQNDWVALCLEHTVKPVLVQIRRRAQIEDFNSQVAEVELFHNKRFLIGVDGRYAVAPAFWQTAIRVVNA